MRFLATLSLSSLVLLTGCNRVTDADREAALETVRKNMDAMQREDVSAVMSTVHSQSPSFAKTEEKARELAEKFDIQYELHSLNVAFATPKEIQVAFDQTMKRIGGEEDFRDNRTSGVHLLRKDGDTWKLWSTKTTRQVFLAAATKEAGEEDAENEEKEDAPASPAPAAQAAPAPQAEAAASTGEQ